MSEYELDMGNPSHRGRVGWDAEKNTYFFHAVDIAQPAGDRQTIMHVGMRYNEIWSLETLDSIVAMYNQAGIPGDVIRALAADSRMGAAATAPSRGLPWPKPL